MNILFFAGFPLKGAGGVGRVSQTLAQEFKKKRHEVIFLAAQTGEERVDDGVRQMFLPESNPRSRENINYLGRLVQEEEIDAIINQSGATPRLMDLVLSVRDKCVILSVHHNCVSCLLNMHRSIIDHTFDRYRVPSLLRPDFAYRLLKARSRRKTGKSFERLARQGDRLVLLAPSFIPELAAFSTHIDLSKVVAIPNPSPFDPDLTALKEKENRILYVGRLANQQKRVDRVLQIWKDLSHRFRDWRLDIVGDGPDREQLKSLSREMGLERITFHGKQDPVPFYRRSKLLLLTSDFEGFGMVLVEAQAFGCVPVVSECFSSVREVVRDLHSGYIVPKAQTEKLTAIVLGAMFDNEHTSRMSEAAVRHSMTFSASLIADVWLSEVNSARGS